MTAIKNKITPMDAKIGTISNQTGHISENIVRFGVASKMGQYLAKG